MQKAKTVAFVAFLAAATGPAAANDFEPELRALAESRISEIAQSPELVAAIKAQNLETAAFDQARIDELDKTWRAEAESASQPMIDKVLSTSVSSWLAGQREASDGLFTEIFVMDAKGLNVAQSDPTSDYWQGDEDKWQQTFGAGPGAVHISELEQDESTQALQSQVSVAVVDPDTGAAIGAVTFGVNVERIE